MRKLTDDELWDLERVASEGVRVLVLRSSDEVEEVYKLIFPSTRDKEYANIEKHKYRSKLGQEEGLMTRRQVEKLYTDDLKDLRIEASELERQADRLKQRFIDNDLTGLPDGQEDPVAFEAAVLECNTEALEITERINRVSSDIREILSFCIEELANQHYMARLTQRCWFQKDEERWTLIWDTWDDYFDDNSSLSSFLKSETLLWLQGGVPPFANSPSQVDGDSDTLTPKTD